MGGSDENAEQIGELQGRVSQLEGDVKALAKTSLRMVEQFEADTASLMSVMQREREDVAKNIRLAGELVNESEATMKGHIVECVSLLDDIRLLHSL